VSGAIILNQIAAARALGGAAKVERALASLTAEQQSELRDLLPVSWCTLSTTRAFHVAMATQMGEPVNLWHPRVVERAMEQTFTTVWRFFMRLTSAEALVKRSATLYAKTYDTGSLEAVIVSPGHSRLTLTGWPDAPDYQLNALATGVTTMLRVAGRSAITVRWVRTPQGAIFDTHTRATS
jgi:hypothetical protein